MVSSLLPVEADQMLRSELSPDEKLLWTGQPLSSRAWYSSIPPEDLSARTRTQNADGSGTLIFTRLSTTQRRAGPDGGSYTVNVGFENIPEVREVEALIERTFHAPEPSRPDLL